MSQLPYSGTLSVPALTVNTTKPLDVRTVVNSVEDLTNGTIPNLYTGIIVNVKGTKDLYVLTSSPRNAQLEESWQKIGADVDLSDYVKIDDLPDFLTESDLDELATKSDLEDYAKKSDIPSENTVDFAVNNHILQLTK